MMRLAAGVAAAKAVGTLARTAGRGGGTSLPGKVLTRVEPHAIGRLARRLERGSVTFSGCACHERLVGIPAQPNLCPGLECGARSAYRQCAAPG